MNLLLSWLLLACAFLLTASLVRGIHVPRWRDAVVVAAVFGLLNAVLGKVLFLLIALGTMGLGFVLSVVTHWLVTAVLLGLTAKLTTRLTVDGVGPALRGGLAIAVISGIGQLVLRLVA
ncbi:MAG: phage holin family protein [Myxococcales bacterium FL481]|nr:MAG: phage holin family protein [Myxococcales bacterium FL481]